MMTRRLLRCLIRTKDVGMKTSTENKLNNHGVALFIVLALILALSALTLLTVDRSTIDIELSFNKRHKDQAFYVAEAGMEHAMIQLYNDQDWRAGFAYETIGEGFYVVMLKDSSTVPALLDTVVVISRGLVGEAVGEIEVHVIKKDIQPFKYSVFSGDALIMKQNGCTDSWNSDSGSYAATYNSTGADIGSNRQVILGQNALIGGDVTSALEDGLILDSGNVIGDTASGVPARDLDILDDADFGDAMANNSAPSGFAGSGYLYSPATGDLTMDTSGTLEMSSGVYYFRNISMRDSSSITVAPNAQVTIYVDGEIDMRHQASMNRDGSPGNFQVLSRGFEFEMSHESEFWGAFYGPNVRFKAKHWIDFYGSLIVKEASLYQDVCIHYDRSLREIAWGGTYEVIAWKEN